MAYWNWKCFDLQNTFVEFLNMVNPRNRPENSTAKQTHVSDNAVVSLGRRFMFD